MVRRILVLSCCATYLAFGLMAGAAHVHRAADPHDEMRGLHLDHAHWGDAIHHGSHGHRERARSEVGESRVDGRDIDHHDKDALYLSVTAHRLLEPGQRVIPATVVTCGTVDAPSFVSLRREEGSNPLRGPPRDGLDPARAPPA